MINGRISVLEKIKNTLLGYIGKKRNAECDHLYFPERYAGSDEYSGQRCALCSKFNSIEDVIPNYAEYKKFIDRQKERNNESI